MALGEADHYQVLMVDPSVDPDILATVYRRLAQRHQPDMGGGESATKRLLTIERAYEVLRDPQRRARYDEALTARGDQDRSPGPAFDPVVIKVATERDRTPRPQLSVNVLDFGRYAGWSLRQLAAHDPDYLEWLVRSPGGRQYRTQITALLGRR